MMIAQHGQAEEMRAITAPIAYCMGCADCRHMVAPLMNASLQKIGLELLQPFLQSFSRLDSLFLAEFAACSVAFTTGFIHNVGSKT